MMMMVIKKIKMMMIMMMMMMMMKPLQVGLDHPGQPDYTHGRAVFNAEEEDPAQTGWGSCYKASTYLLEVSTNLRKVSE